MARQCSSFPFRWVLPYAQLFVCIAVLWPDRGFLLFEASSGRSGQVANERDLTTSRSPFLGLIVKVRRLR